MNALWLFVATVFGVIVGNVASIVFASWWRKYVIRKAYETLSTTYVDYSSPGKTSLTPGVKQ